MTRTEFAAEFAAMLELPAESLTDETELRNIDTWDSVAYLSSMLLIDEKLGIPVRPEAIAAAGTFADILALVASALQP